MRLFNKIVVLSSVMWAAYSSIAFADERGLAEVLLDADNKHLPIPVLSIEHTIPDPAMAYRIQKKYVEYKLKSEKIGGVKAGLTSKASQKKFSVDEPIAGVLFQSGRLSNHAIVDKKQFHLLMLETEIGFVVSSRLAKRVPDVNTLQQSIKSIMPVIELPDLGFADMKKLKGLDIIAANVSSKQYIVGEAKPFKGKNLNDIGVRLLHNGQVVNTGKGSDASGDQWQAALWLVNTMIEQGWVIEPGQLLITGALGNMLPGKTGQYEADYGDFGSITFEVRD